MPFVRFSRDKRGYEYVYLMDVPSRQGRGAHPRVLYWFRTPPGLKVGREPFDKAAQQALETRYPELTFDWKQIRETPKPPPDAGAPWRERRRLERAAKRARAAEEVRELEETAGPEDEDAGGEDAGPEHEDERLEATPGGGEDTAEPSSRDEYSVRTPVAESGTPAVSAAAPADQARTGEAPQGGDPSGRPRRRRRRRGGRGRRQTAAQPLEAAPADSPPDDSVVPPGSERAPGEAELAGADPDGGDDVDDGAADGNPENDG